MNAVDEARGMAALEVHEVQTLTQKLVDVALEIGFIEKKGYNQAQSYAFVRGDDVIADVRVQMLQRHVLLLAGLKGITERTRATRGGGETTISTLDVEFIFHDADTGEQKALPWAGQGEDPGDKGLGKAFTNGLKTFLRQQLMIPWGHEDPEADTGSDERVGNGQTVNLIEAARGLNNAQLNAALVKVGLPAQQAPFGHFMRVPSELAERVKAALDEERGVSYDRAHKHTWAKRKVHVDQCHCIVVVRTCSDCGETDETEVERDFHRNPLQIVFAREDCPRCRRLAYGIEPASWEAMT